MVRPGRTLALRRECGSGVLEREALPLVNVARCALVEAPTGAVRISPRERCGSKPAALNQMV
jgi:hypothetical protein